MKALKLLALAAGLALFVWILSGTDLRSVGGLIARIGGTGALAIVVAFAVGFAADVGTWLLLFRSLALSWMWARRLWLVQMVGEALNVLAPFGSLSGEPFKALLLKRHYQVSYSESAASLLLLQTANSLAEVPFAIIGVVLLVRRHLLAPALEAVVVAAVGVITLFMALVIVLLHLRTLAAVEQRLRRSRWGTRLATGLSAVKHIEEHLFHVVRRTPGRFASAFALSFLNWFMGAVEMFLIFRFLGQPITPGEAWLTEAAVVLVRSATFFVPAHIGAQDGAIALLAGALTGSPEMGVAVALVRRGRELAWSAVGLTIGGWFGLKEPTLAA